MLICNQSSLHLSLPQNVFLSPFISWLHPVPNSTPRAMWVAALGNRKLGLEFPCPVYYWQTSLSPRAPRKELLVSARVLCHFGWGVQTAARDCVLWPASSLPRLHMEWCEMTWSSVFLSFVKQTGEKPLCFLPRCNKGERRNQSLLWCLLLFPCATDRRPSASIKLPCCGRVRNCWVSLVAPLFLCEGDVACPTPCSDHD